VLLIDLLIALGRNWRTCADKMEEACELNLGLPDQGPPCPWDMVELPSEKGKAFEQVRQSMFREILAERPRSLFDKYMNHPIHSIVSRVSELSETSTHDLTMFAWRAPLRDGLHPGPYFAQDLRGLVLKLKLLDQDGTTEIIVGEFYSELIALGIVQPVEQRKFGF
jgi:hypothetical protein